MSECGQDSENWQGTRPESSELKVVWTVNPKLVYLRVLTVLFPLSITHVRIPYMIGQMSGVITMLLSLLYSRTALMVICWRYWMSFDAKGLGIFANERYCLSKNFK